jgi:hypothetical protein
MLWAPRGPGYGTGEVLLDGGRRMIVNFNSPKPEMSQPFFASGPLEGAYHAISVRATERVIPLDCVEVVQ